MSVAVTKLFEPEALAGSVSRSAEDVADPRGLREATGLVAPAPSPLGRMIEIGFLNLLPDAALGSGERQVAGLLRAVAGPLRLHLRFLTLPAIARGAAARAHLAAAGYADAPAAGRLDGLFVSGTEPRSARLVDEPVWPQLARMVDWARTNTRSTIWSCFAAHAAVLRLDNVERQPLDAKCFGLFPVESVVPSAPRPGVAGKGPEPVVVSHSRWNDLNERSLIEAGYEILTRGPAGVDSFTKRVSPIAGPDIEGASGSRFLFFQGHPEYDAGALGREYRRDVGRFLSRRSDNYPALPVAYFAAATEDALRRFAEDAKRHRSPDRLARLPPLDPVPDGGRHLAFGKAVFGDWLRDLGRQAP